MRLNESYSFLLLSIAVALLPLCPQPARADSTDVFPLARGLHCVYHFTTDTAGWSWSDYWGSRDSGTAAYNVLDSSAQGDTVLIWIIAQKIAAQRRVSRSHLPDTAYAVTDSSVFSLAEGMTGRHELRCSALVWGFGDLHSMVPIFRYTDGSPLVTAGPFEHCVFADTNYDSLWFSSDSGLVWRSRSTCWDADEVGEATWLNARFISRTLVSVKEQDVLPARVTLLPNYPNPFNTATTIGFELPHSSVITVAVYDILGRRIALLAEGVYTAGPHRLVFSGQSLGSGIYIVRLQTPVTVNTQKILLVK